MVFSERLRTHTLPKLTDVTVAALLSALAFPRAQHPPGVFEATAERFRDSRFGWAAEYIAAEIAAAPGVTVCTRTGLGVVWSEIHHPTVANPNMARARGKLIAETATSFNDEMIRELVATLSTATAVALNQAYLENRAKRPPPTQRQRAQRDEFEDVLAAAKKLERELRAEFDVADLGPTPSPAERRAVVGILSTGATGEQLLEALEGRAADCRVSRHWDGKDTADLYLRITWICARPKRFEKALGAVPAEEPLPAEFIRNEHGTFIGGRELAEPVPEALEPPTIGGGLEVIQGWLDRTE